MIIVMDERNSLFCWYISDENTSFKTLTTAVNIIKLLLFFTKTVAKKAGVFLPAQTMSG
jgi:hypothetical protein